MLFTRFIFVIFLSFLHLEVKSSVSDSQKDQFLMEKEKHARHFIKTLPLTITEAERRTIFHNIVNKGLLNLDNLALTNLDDTTLSKITWLTEISLYKNKLENLPKSFKNLSNLKILNLQNNKFNFFPKQIFFLPHLQYLNIGNFIGDDHELETRNEINIIPSQIKKLNQLRDLSVANCNLREISAEIGCLTHLKTLYISYNPIDSLPPEIGQLYHLERLICQFTNLVTLPKKLETLKNLHDILI